MNRSKGKARPQTSRRNTIAKRRPQSRRVAPQRRSGNNNYSSKSILGAVKNALGGLSLSDLGGTIGGTFGGPAGLFAGNAIGRAVSRVTGLGAYKVQENSLVTDNGPPMFGNAGEGGTLITKREFLQDISGSTAFTNTTFPINAGLVATFPWLSQIAANYEQYRFEGLLFEFKSTSANALNSTNTALGTVIMSTNYDTLDSAFSSKQQMEAYEFTTSAVPSQCSIHPVECKPRLNALTNYYVRSGSVPSTGDQRFYDLGLFQIATSGMQAAAVIGELWVSYKIRLLKPKLQTPLGANLLQAHYSTIPVTAVTAWGTAVQKSGSGMTLTFTNTTISIPFVGRYLVVVNANAGTTYTRGAAITASTNATSATSSTTFPYVAVNGNSSVAGNGTTNYTEYFVVDITAAGGLVTTSAPTIVGAVTGEVIVTQLSSGLL